MKSRGGITLIIIVLLIVGGLFVFRLSNAPEETFPLDPPQMEPFEAPDDWLTYVNHRGCFSLQYPPGAEVFDEFLDGPPATGFGFDGFISVSEESSDFYRSIDFGIVLAEELESINPSDSSKPSGDILYAFARGVWDPNQKISRSELIPVSVGNAEGYAFSYQGRLVYPFPSEPRFNQDDDIRTIVFVMHQDNIIRIDYYSGHDPDGSIPQTLRLLDCDTLDAVSESE